MTPTADDLAALADLPVAEALEVAESRGLVPVGWASDTGRAWDVSSAIAWGSGPEVMRVDGVTYVGAGFEARSDPSQPVRRMWLMRGEHTRQTTLEGDGASAALARLAAQWPEPATTADLCAVLAIDWRRAEVLAREVVGTLREYGRRGGDVRVVWRVVKLEPMGPHDLISPTLRTLDRSWAWRNDEGDRTTFWLWGDGVMSGRTERLPAAAEIVAMGLRLGRITDDAVTLVCARAS